MNKSRTYNGIRNVIVTLTGTLFSILLQFVGRTFFIKLLSTEYLGLSGLFADILNVLALSELGVGSAMVFALYKPVAEGDTEKIKSLMQLYKRMYFVIGLTIFIVGASATPFLQYLIKDMPDIPWIHIYYLMYVFNTGISYFFVYKKSLIICYQEEYIATIVTMITSICNRFLQIVVLIVTKSFLCYLLVQILFTFLENFVDSVIANRKYPFLKSKQITKLSREDIADIKKNIKAMMAHKIGTVVVKSTDSMIISKLLGLNLLGLYSNYNLIIYNVTAILQKMLWTLTASLGNLVTEGDLDKSKKVFHNILFVTFWIYCFCSICIFCLINPFITIWLGQQYLLEIQAVAIFTICFFIEGIRQPALLMRDATGVFYNDRYKPLAEALVNLVVSIPLTYKLGIAGVKLGTIISYIFVALWVEGYVLYKHYFKQSVVKYLLRLLGYFCALMGLAGTTYFLCNLVDLQGIVNLVVRAVICIVYPNLIIVITCRQRPEFEYFVALLRRFIDKRGQNSQSLHTK